MRRGSFSLSLSSTRLTTKKKRTYVRGDLISYTIMQEVYYHFSSKFRLEIQKVLRNSLVRDSLILYTSDLSRYRLSKSLRFTNFALYLCKETHEVLRDFVKSLHRYTSFEISLDLCSSRTSRRTPPPSPHRFTLPNSFYIITKI